MSNWKISFQKESHNIMNLISIILQGDFYGGGTVTFSHQCGKIQMSIFNSVELIELNIVILTFVVHLINSQFT